ncbi:MAG: PspA/IM30 family protein [Symploca sp. SIO3C6]|uniref:PspA/IM30 family protein n=1 Tax=Symploca sp. SIO1C4 TaxID=2607765 RepID=A0A6B3NLN0_9CYAN|nr:PspA/IM30 family protein [Symploca sp. SIO3C6]NER31352.1 PspA/IM30 family protein [Symploca sp. SIO1C4]
MGLIDRIVRVIRANLNSLIDKSEDPEKILEQAVEDMQQDLIELRQAVAQAIASQKRTERQATQAQYQAEQWYKKAQLALSKGNENLAREALSRRKSYQGIAQAMGVQLEQQNTVVTKLKQNMRTLESKISEARTKKDLYIARARSAQASQKIQEMLGNLGTGSAMNALEQMEDKVMQLEAESEALDTLGGDQLEKKFAALEGENDIDAELAQMKAKLIPGVQPPNISSSQTPSADN